MTNATATETNIEVGTLATDNCGSDCYPMVVTKVSASGKSITVNAVETILVRVVGRDGTVDPGDWYYASKGRLILGDTAKVGTTYTLRKNGEWVAKGQPMTRRALSVGDAVWHRDPSF